MWLASFSRRTLDGQIYPTTEWSARDRETAERELRGAVEGVGDPDYERMFRMVVTACFQRGLSAEEMERLPPSCRIPPKHLAGGSIEVLLHKGPPQPLSSRPCEHVGREDLRARLPGAPWPRIWIPVDCGGCGPCRARDEIAGRSAS